MEVRSKDCTIKVDNKGFNMDPASRFTLEAICALVSCLSRTGDHEEAQVGLLDVILRQLQKHDRNKRFLRDLDKYYRATEQDNSKAIDDLLNNQGW